MNLRKLHYFVFFLFVYSMNLNAETYHYAGVSFLGSAAYIEQAYPQALSMSEQKSGNTLNNTFRQAISTSPPKAVDLNFGLADKDEGQSRIVSLAIDREYTSVESFGDSVKVIAEASAQLLFVDFEHLTLIASYPISISVNEVYEHFDDSKKRSLFESLYLGGDGDDGLVQLAADKLSDLDLQDLADGIRFQVGDVRVSDDAAKALVEPESLFKQFAGQYFTNELSSQYQINVIPFVKGYAVGNVMAGRFSNGEVFSLRLPEPDYVFSIDILGFDKAKQDDYLLYASIINVVLEQSEFECVYLNDDFLYIAHKLIGRTQQSADDWGAFEDALTALIDDFISQLGEPNKKWIKDHAKDKKVYKRFKSKSTLFKDRS